MISLRTHTISLAAVFLALAIGVVLTALTVFLRTRTLARNLRNRA